MEIFFRMLSTQGLMFVYMCTGILLVKCKVIRQEGRSSLIGLLLNLALPCMILHSFESDGGASELLQGGEALLLSFLCCLFSLFLGKVLWRKKEESRRATLEFATMFSNAGNAGLPIVSLAFGTEGVLIASFFLIPIRVFMWTVGLSLFVKREEGESRGKELVRNPSLWVVFVGIFLLLTGLRLPGVLGTAVKNIGDMTGPLSMIMIGGSLVDMRLSDWKDVDVLLMAALRLGVLPVLALGLMRLAHVPTACVQVAVTLLAMPVAANTSLLSEMYGRDYSFATKCVVVSTVLSLATVPCVTLLF